ncbi:MAG: helix-turn-helix domain-containing protein [Halobacteriota archaeon]
MILELHLDSEILASALEQTPGMHLSVEELTGSDEIPLRGLVWARGGDFARFEAAMRADETVVDSTVLADTDRGRLYRVHCSEDVPAVEVYRGSVAFDGVVLGAENDGDGWTARLLFPDRERVSAFVSRCRETDISIKIESVYDKHSVRSSGSFGLTANQHEALLLAEAEGYFAVPRRCSTSEVGEMLDISSQAVSERLRRGMRRLVRSTLITDHEYE